LQTSFGNATQDCRKDCCCRTWRKDLIV
jgi:hypothetical protein